MSEPSPAPEKPEIISTVKARGGVVGHNVRYVLAISLLLAVAAMVSVYVASADRLEDAPNSAVAPTPD
jgi:hypothetical protein